MSALGARLRAAREGRGASLEAASREAGVPLRYLQMLEAGHFPTVADPAYLTHFLRRYASYLGLDTEAAARDFLSETEPEAVARRTPPEVRAATGKPRLRPRSLPP
ncbi:MAG: helix-turn-helix domain-containing protein, partial [Candidatus Binatia bacterium]